VVTGVATPCVGVTTSIEYAMMAVGVTISQHSHVVSRQVVRGSHTFRFIEPPGNYELTSDQQYVSPQSVAVDSGQTVRLTLKASCR
jgi:hypothetical protein